MKKKKGLLVAGILIGILCVVGVSYAIWQVTHIQTGENSLTVGCFKVEFTDLNPIQIGKAYPIEDSVGKTLTPYEFTITNTCNDLASYQINLEVLNESTLNEHSYIKSMLDEERPNLLTTNQVVEKTLENANTAYKLKKSFLSANETKSFTLRLWLDKNTPPSEEIMNSVFKSKVTVTTSFIDEAPLASGTLRTINYDDKVGLWQYKENITKLIIEDEIKPIGGAIGSFDESSTQDKSVMSYVVENKKENELDETTYTAYLQSNEKLYLNDGRCLFYNFKKLESIEGIRYMDTSNITNIDYMFKGCSSLTSLDLSSFNTSNVQNMQSIFENCSNLISINLKNFVTENVIKIESMFEGCTGLASLDLSSFKTENVTDMSRMFINCKSLTNLNLNNFNTKNVTSTFMMFLGCENLESLDLSNFDTFKVTNLARMFEDCKNLKSLNIKQFNTSNVTSMQYMFSGCSSLTGLELSNFDTTLVTDMTCMFDNCKSLISLDLSSFNTPNLENMYSMFRGCENLTSINLKNFDTRNVSSMTMLFLNCQNLSSLDLENFDTRNVIDMSWMFSDCGQLTTILYSESFIHNENATISNMFTDCPANKPEHESWSGITF